MRKIGIILSWIFIAACAAVFVFIPKEEAKEAVKKELTLEQKMGQVFMIGIEGKTITGETERLIKKLHPGAVLLLGKNIGTEDELKGLISSLQKIAVEDTGLPLFIAIDQEGGEVSRISWVEKTAQSEIKSEDEAYNVGRRRGSQLKELGINLNLAPLLDALSKNDFISPRGFLKDSGKLGNKITEGQRDAGILSCIKHFPGYGGILIHPEDNLTHSAKFPVFSQFREVENPEMIMVSNAIYEEDSSPFAFLESRINFLKENIPGDYLVMSDDLSQYSLLNNYSLEDIVSKPINAGINIVIFSGHRSSIEEGVSEAVKAANEGKIDKQKLDESVQKIIGLKGRYFNLI